MIANGIYKRMEELVVREALQFSGNHFTHMEYFLKEDKNFFLKTVERETRWYSDSQDAVLTDCQCQHCGKNVDYRLEGNKLIPIKEECFEVKESYFFDFELPSGELLLADWFRTNHDLLKDLDGRENINALQGKIERIGNYHKANIGHIFTGNTSPTVFKKDNTLLIGKPEYDEENDEDIPFEEGLESQGYVTTDLWWVTMVDHAVMEQKAIDALGKKEAKTFMKDFEEEAHVRVKVAPGTYRLTHYLPGSREDDLYATFVKID